MTVNKKNIPSLLQAMPCWLVWRYETREDGKPTKVPYSVHGGRASTTNPATWAGYEEAMQLYEAGGFDGVGICVSDGIGAIDIDHCVKDGELSPMAAEIIAKMNSYTEYSPSGEGIRILFHAPGFQYDTVRYYKKNPHNGLEIYIAGCTDRYVTITGNTLGDMQIEERAAEVAEVLEAHMVRPNAKAKQEPLPQVATPTPSINDLDLINKISASHQGELFRRLWQGDISGHNNDDSAADIALCNILAFWTGKDAQRMDWLFKQSGLYRPKWDERRGATTYGAMTIDRAIQDCKKVYDGGLVVHEAKQPKPPEQSTEWEAPRAFTDDRLPDFPVDSLPPALRDFALAVAESVQVPVDMPAVCGLAISALCVQKKFKIKGKPGYIEPLNLYTNMVAAPGERKSAVTSIMAAPVFRYEETRNDFLQSLVDEYEIKHSVLSKQIKGLEDKAAKDTKTGGEPIEWDAEITGDSALNKALDKRRELADLEARQPRLVRLWTDDVTPEALTSLLAENDGKMAVISAEGGIFDTLNGRYTNGVNIDIMLKAHAGDSVRVDRKGRPSEYIRNPAMTIFLAIQPHVLDGLMDNSAFRGRGLTARFLYSMPVTKVGHRAYETAEIPQAVSDAYDTMVRGLLAIEQPKGETIIGLSPDAYALSSAFFYELEPRLKDDLENMGDWAGKLHGATLRIAGVLHTIQHGTGAGEQAVSADTMCSAITIGKYFLEHAQAAYRLMGADRLSVEARYILRMLEKEKPKEISSRDLVRLCRKFATVEEMQPAVDLLIDFNYLREMSTEYKGTGRRPSPKYEINPAAYVTNVTEVTEQ